MKRILVLLWLLMPLFLGAQVITYDTIKVSADDSRNIHRHRINDTKSTSEARQKTIAKTSNAPLSTFDRSKLRIGANLGLSISSNYTNISIGPQLGYQFNQYVMAGAGIKYYYWRSRTPSYEVRNHLLGANAFGYLYPVRFITFFAQPELNYTWSKLSDRTGENTPVKERGLVPSLVIGGGLRFGRSHITLNYDLVQDDNSPHPSGVYLGISAFF